MNGVTWSLRSSLGLVAEKKLDPIVDKIKLDLIGKLDGEDHNSNYNKIATWMRRFQS